LLPVTRPDAPDMLDLDLCQDRGVRLRKFQWDAPAQALAVS